MTISDKATITTQELVTVHMEGFESIQDMKKVSEWNGMWELSGNGGKVILMADVGPFNGLFDGVFGPKPRDVRIVAATPSLLVPIGKEVGQ